MPNCTGWSAMPENTSSSYSQAARRFSVIGQTGEIEVNYILVCSLLTCKGDSP
jgi:hypothetical protein